MEQFSEMKLALSSITKLCDSQDLPQKPDSFPKLSFKVPSPSEVFNLSKLNIAVSKMNSSDDSQGSDSDTQEPLTKKLKLGVL